MKKRILFFVTQSEFGGAQRFLFNINSELQDAYSTLICAGPDGGGAFFDALKEANIPHENFKYLRREIRPFDDIHCLFTMIVKILVFKPDILFFNSSKAGVLGTIAGNIASIIRWQKIPIIYRIDWAFNDPRPPREKKLYVFLERFLSGWRDIIIQNDRFDLKTAQESGIKPRYGFKIIYNGIDPMKLNFLAKKEAREALEARLGQSLENFQYLVTNTANYYPAKGLTYLIDGFIDLVQQGYNAGLLLIGDGQERPMLEKKIRDNGMKDNIFLLGQIPDAYQYLKASDIFCFSSVKEGFPWAILEATAARIPIIATRVGALPEILTDGFSALLIEPGDRQAITENIIHLIQQPEMRVELTEHAFTNVTLKFTLRNLVMNYKDLFEKVSAGNFRSIQYDA